MGPSLGHGGNEGDGVRPPAAPWKRSPLFWLLVATSVVTLAIGVWQLVAGRAGTSQGSVDRDGRGDLAPVATEWVAPDFRLAAADGSVFSLSEQRGKVVLLNFWATWCPPCKAEMPDLNALHREYGSTRQLVVVGMDVGESPSTVQAFALKHGITFPQLLDAAGQVSSDLFQVRTLPTTLVIDRQGRVRDRWTGRLSKAAMVARLERVW